MGTSVSRAAITDKLDSLGNTAAIGKGSPWLGAARRLGIFAAYRIEAGSRASTSSTARHGGRLYRRRHALSRLALTMRSVGRAALKVVLEVRRSSRDPGSWKDGRPQTITAPSPSAPTRRCGRWCSPHSHGRRAVVTLSVHSAKGPRRLLVGTTVVGCCSPSTWPMAAALGTTQEVHRGRQLRGKAPMRTRRRRWRYDCDPFKILGTGLTSSSS